MAWPFHILMLEDLWKCCAGVSVMSGVAAVVEVVVVCLATARAESEACAKTCMAGLFTIFGSLLSAPI